MSETPAQRVDEALSRIGARLREIEELLADRRMDLLKGEAQLSDLMELQTERFLLREFMEDSHHLRTAAKRLSDGEV